MRAALASFCLLGSLPSRVAAAVAAEERQRNRSRETRNKRDNKSPVTVARMNASGPVARSFGPVAGLGMASMAAAAYSIATKLRRAGAKGLAVEVRDEKEDKPALARDAVVRALKDGSGSNGMGSISSAAASAAAEAAKAAGRATAAATITREQDAAGPGATDVPLEIAEVRTCVDAALESSSRQTELAVLDVSETLLGRLQAKDEEIRQLQRSLVTSEEVAKSVREIRLTTEERLRELFGEMDAMRGKLRDVVGQRDEAVAEAESLRAAAAGVDEDLRGRLEEAEREREDQRSALERTQAELESATAAREELERRASAEAEAAEGLGSEIEGLRQRLGEAEESALALEAAAEERLSERDTALEEAEVLQRRLEELESKIEARAAEALSEREEEARAAEALRERVEELEAERAAAAAEGGSEVAELRAECEGLRADLARQKQKSDKGHDLLFESNQERNRLAGELEQRKSELEEALAVVSDLRSALGESKEKGQDLEEACTSLRARLEENNNELDRELQEREKEVKEMNGLLVRLKQSGDTVEELKRELIQAKAERAERDQEVAQLRAKVAEAAAGNEDGAIAAAAETEELREYIRQQKRQIEQKEGSARVLAGLIKDLHTLTSQLTP